jgi:hypothetical protein
MSPRRRVIIKKMIIMKKMISLEKRVMQRILMQRIPPLGRNAANADHPSRARCLCHF